LGPPRSMRSMRGERGEQRKAARSELGKTNGKIRATQDLKLRHNTKKKKRAAEKLIEPSLKRRRRKNLRTTAGERDHQRKMEKNGMWCGTSRKNAITKWLIASRRAHGAGGKGNQKKKRPSIQPKTSRDRLDTAGHRRQKIRLPFENPWRHEVNKKVKRINQQFVGAAMERLVKGEGREKVAQILRRGSLQNNWWENGEINSQSERQKS